MVRISVGETVQAIKRMGKDKASSADGILDILFKEEELRKVRDRYGQTLEDVQTRLGMNLQERK